MAIADYARRLRQRPTIVQKLLVVLIFALLVCNTARGLASGLAGSLALAATAGLNSFLNILGFDGLDSAHGNTLLVDYARHTAL